MASIKVKYEALKPSLKTQTQLFTGSTTLECWQQFDEFNAWISKGDNIKEMYNITIVEKKY